MKLLKGLSAWERATTETVPTRPPHEHLSVRYEAPFHFLQEQTSQEAISRNLARICQEAEDTDAAVSTVRCGHSLHARKSTANACLLSQLPEEFTLRAYFPLHQSCHTNQVLHDGKGAEYLHICKQDTPEATSAPVPLGHQAADFSKHGPASI